MPRRDVRRQNEDPDEDEVEDEAEEIDELDEEQDQEDEIDEEIRDTFDEAQQLDYGREDLIRKLRKHTARTPKLSGGELEAAWDDADADEKSVGGRNPAPDQSDVDDEGDALGITYQDDEPLRSTDKPDKRTRHRWELNPASSADHDERSSRGLEAPVKRRFAQSSRVHREEGHKERRTSAGNTSRKTAASTPTTGSSGRTGGRTSANKARRTGSGAGVGSANGSGRSRAKKTNRRGSKRI